MSFTARIAMAMLVAGFIIEHERWVTVRVPQTIGLEVCTCSMEFEVQTTSHLNNVKFIKALVIIVSVLLLIHIIPRVSS